MKYYRQTYCSTNLQKSDPDQRSGMDVFWHCDEAMAVIRVLVRFGNGKVRRYDKGHRADGFCTLAIVFNPETNRRFGQVAEISEQTFLEVWNKPEAANEDRAARN